MLPLQYIMRSPVLKIYYNDFANVVIIFCYFVFRSSFNILINEMEWKNVLLDYLSYSFNVFFVFGPDYNCGYEICCKKS